jgi:hypothetical protein
VHGWYHFKKLYYKGLLKPTINLKLFTLLKANHFGIKRKVQLWFSKTINTPVTFGFLKPVIVLPVALLNQLTLQQAETLILHELTHIKANDYLLNWILLIVENIFFFNPFVLILCADIRLEREKYCDSNVMAFEYSPLLYAETLLQTQNYQQYIPLHQLAAVNGKTQLFKRIQFFTNTNNLTHQKRNKVILPIFSTLVILVFGTTIFFQYQIATKPKIVEPTTFAPFYENTIELNTPTFVNNILENLTDDKLKLIKATAEKQKPVFEKQLKKLEPLIQSIQNRAEIITGEINENFVTPVAFKENDATRQIIIKEEQSGSKNATVKVYTVSFINGEWVLIPEWMLASKEINTDTLLKIIDTSNIKKNPF